ncbi:hypothetical protein [Streptomyces murinus]|uniref:hypothetical protein n=1 Tax=Streptomyces murinus TaxID=33900 RepID=UPI003803478C
MCVLLVYLSVIQLALVALEASSKPPQDAPLALRPGWAAVSAAADVLVLAALAWFLVRACIDPGIAEVPAPTAAGFCAVFSVPALGALRYFAHDRAVQADETAAGRDGRPGSDDARG